MPESQKYSINRAWKLIRKALNSTEQRDWWDEYEDSINAIDADVQGVDEKIDNLTAASIAYDNTTSGLTATEVQAAIDEVADFAIPAHAPTHQAGGSDVINVAGLIGELATLQNAGKLQGLAISVTTPTGGQVLTYNATTMEWEPAAGGGGTLQSAYDGGNEVALDRITKGDFRIVGAGGVVIDVAFDVEIATTGKVKFRTGSAGAPSNWFELDYTTGNVLLGGNHEMVLTANGGEGLNIAARKLVMNVQTNVELYAGEGLNIAARELVMNVQTNAGLYANGTWLQSSQGNMVLNSNLGDVTFNDKNTPLAIKFSDSSNTAFTTTNKSVVGAVNEVKAAIGGLIMTQVMATVTDTPITLTNQSPRNIMLTGSASGVVVSLPDATTLSVGDTWTIKNASSEFVIVQNSGTASSAFEFVAPRAFIEIACSGKANAAGTWVWDRSDYLKMKSMKGRDYDTLDNNTITGASASGTGAAVNQGYNGNLSLQTGTTSTGRIGGTLNNACFMGSSGNQGAMILDVTASFASGLSDVTDEYWGIIGIHSQYNGTIENGFFWRYDRATYGDAKFRRVLAEAGVMTPTDTGISATVSFRRLTLVTNSAKNRIDWYIDKALVGTDTGVTFANILEPDFVIVKSAGSTSRQLRIDRISYWVALPERV